MIVEERGNAGENLRKLRSQERDRNERYHDIDEIYH